MGQTGKLRNLLLLSFAISLALSLTSNAQEHDSAQTARAEPNYCPAMHTSEPRVSNPPAPYSSFYPKYLDANGIAILATDNVCDRSLQIAYSIVLHMLSQRQDIRQRMADLEARAVICAIHQKQTDLPEFKHLLGKRAYDRACGATGFKNNPVSATSEENILGVLDPVKGRSIFIHEFGHLIHNVGLSEDEREEVRQLYKQAQDQHLFPPNRGRPPSYAMTNEMEFFAMATGAWFSAANWSAPFNSVHERTRETQAAHDPDLDRFLRTIYPADVWRFPDR